MAFTISKVGGNLKIDDGTHAEYYPVDDVVLKTSGTTLTIFHNEQEVRKIPYAQITSPSGADVETIADEVSAMLDDNKDYWVNHAQRNIFADFGDRVSVETKQKDLLKFGRNELVNTTKSTIMTLPAGIDNETYVSSNLITQISSSSTSDTGNVTIEGHTSSDGLTFVFSTQTIALTGQTAATLATPIARVSRVVNASSSDLLGNIYVAQTDALNSGVPVTDAKVHLILVAGLNNSEKASTTISSTDYYIMTSFYADCLEKTAAFSTIHLEVRESGKTFINKVDIEASTNNAGKHDFKPYLVIPKNADVRLRASANAADKDVSGGFEGLLAKVI